MRLAILAALAFIGLAAAPALAADWATYRYPDLGFSVALPGAPTRINKPTETSGGSIPTEFVYFLEAGGLYFVSSSDMTSQTEALKDRDHAARGILDGALQTGTVVAAPTHLSAPAAWEGSTQSEGKLIRVRTYVRGKRGMTVMIIAPAGQPERTSDAAAQRFFASFTPDGS